MPSWGWYDINSTWWITINFTLLADCLRSRPDFRPRVSSGCADFLENLSVMIFSDYRMIYKFAEDCGADIDKHQCGRLEDDDEVSFSTPAQSRLSSFCCRMSIACTAQYKHVQSVRFTVVRFVILRLVYTGTYSSIHPLA